MILFAAPDFGTGGAAQPAHRRSASQPMTVWRGTEKRSLQGVEFGPLKGTRDESERLLQLFKAWHWPSQIHIGPEATKAALLEVRSPFILHLATHGFFEPQDPSQNAAESVDDKPSVFQSKFFANPMHQSGLVLSGANLTLKLWDEGEEAASVDNDGILTAEDVSTLELQSTWLVTLSACNTAEGEARAGKVLWACAVVSPRPGAQNLLMTLWSISDETTVRIMS